MNRRRVVVVDDLAEMRHVLRLMLEHGGPFEVVGEGANGHEAIELAQTLQPDVLLMDVAMPDGPSGWRALPTIREVAPSTAVVILSGSRVDPEQPKGEGLAAAVLEKGLPPDELVAALARVLSLPPDALPVPAGEQRERARGSEQLERFASVAGHDLAQPLQIAYGYLEMLRTDYGPGLDATAVGWLDASIGALERMRSLVQGLLLFARAGNTDPAPVSVALGGAVDAAVATLASRGVVVAVHADGLPVVTADPRDLVEVLTQLLDNVGKFGGGTATIAAEEADEGWVVTVADDGPGVPEALRPRAFEVLQREATSAVDGAGIGLALSRKLIERHGGRIWLEPPSPGSTGAVFRFSLPSALT